MFEPTTFYTPDRSQIVLQISLRKSVIVWCLVGGLGFVSFLMILFFMVSILSGDFSLLGMVALIWIGLLLLLIYFLLTKEVITLSSEGLTHQKKGFFPKESFYEISLIKGIEMVWVSNGKSGYDAIRFNLKDGKCVEVENIGFITKKNKKIFVEECKEFLKEIKGTVEESTSTVENAGEEQREVIDPEMDALFFADQPTDSKWVRDEEASEFTIVRKGEFSLKSFLSFLGSCFITNIVCLCIIWGDKNAREGILQGKLWVICIFLIVFVIINLGFLWGILSQLFANWMVEKWTITPDEIRYEKKNLGIKSRRRFDVSRIERVEFESGYLLFVAGKIGEEDVICGIPLDSQEEAHWLGARFYQIRGKV